MAEILCKIEGDIIVETQIHSDSLETDLISQISGALCEIKFNPDDIQSCLANFKAELSEPVKIQITDDICDAIIKEIK